MRSTDAGNGLSMSEDELKKWENKFRLWRVLHPEFENWPILCRACPYDPDNICVQAGFEEELLHAKSRSGKSFLYMKGRINGLVCVEWVRHV